MLTKLLEPKVDLAALVLRVGLAGIFIVHGFIKVVQERPLIPELSQATQTAVGWAELLFGLALLVGLLSRVSALGVIVLQVGAMILVTGKRALEGPAMSMSGADYMKVGPEFNLVLIALCVGVILLGSGTVSLDHLLGRLWQRRRAPAAPPAVAGAK
jgi:uncharacterized membrane protein YphA (DoxX/SURF4 family)